jgi:hypothetical protein
VWDSPTFCRPRFGLQAEPFESSLYTFDAGFSRRLACKLVASNPTREHARSLHKKIKPLTGLFLFGGEGGIRTHGGLAPTPDFESGTFDHSATSPIRFYAAWLLSKSAIVAEQAMYSFILRLKYFDSTHIRP